MSWFDQFNIGKLKPQVNPVPPPYNEGGSAPPPSSGGPETGVPTVPGTTPPPAAAWNPGTAPSGWDPVKWADQNHQTDKYKVGRILAKYPPTVDGLKQAIPELQAAYPGLTFDGKDSITVPGLGPIDVLQGASNGGVAWQWIDINEEAKQKAAAANGLSNLPSNAAPPPGGWGGGAFGSAGGGGTSGWSMPKGSTYQFGGVPGFNTGVTGADKSGLVGGSRDRLGMDAGSGATTGAFGQTSSPTGSFGVGQIASSMPSTTTDPHGGATGHAGATTTGGGAFGSYDRAPSFTPMDPFAPPPSPDAAVSAGEKFVLPTGQAALDADPGYKFRLSQGLDALQNSASAKGLLRTGGTLKGLQDFGQQMASQEYQNAVDRAVQTYGLNEGTRRFDTGFNADQQQQKYKNTFDALNQRYAYANQQNLAGNNQALEGYKTDVGRELGRMGIQLTADQNAVVNGLNAQQQQWMQAYMMNGQSFDQAYKLLMANLQYPS